MSKSYDIDHEADAMREFVEQMARMTTATDGVEGQDACDDAMADLDDETLCSDVAAFYEMVRLARRLVAK